MQSGFLKSGLQTVSAAALAVAAYGWWDNAHAVHAEPTAVPQPAVIQARSGLPDFSAIVQAYGASVVNITVAADERKTVMRSPELNPDDPMFDFFRHFGVPAPRPEGPGMAEGSGFIVSGDGVILTNAHVVADASEVTVKLNDRREFKARVVGLDKSSDVAVLKIDAKGLPAVRLGDSGKLKVGEWVLAIGSPFGFENSVTAGIVSAKSRSLPDENYVPFIQTDVAVNPGNSGGPLFNLQGEVVGINSQIYSRSGGYQGLSFAIPIDIAMKVEKQIVTHGKVVRGRIGAVIQDMNQDLADSFGLKSPDGALVSSVEPDSPAARAGLQPGDVVLAINGEHIGTSKDLPPMVANLSPGSDATMEIWRKHRSQQLSVRIGALRDQSEVADAGPAEQGRLGLALRPLAPEERRQLHVEGGLLVAEATGAAARAGVRPGDVILSANDTPVKSVEQLRFLTQKAGHNIALLIQRDTTKIFVPVRLG